MPGPTSWAARRPTLTAALVYLLLSLAMFVPALAPGRTLSVSDYLWTATPWDSSRPADVPVLGSNREQTDSVFMFQPFLQHTRAELPDIPLWNPYVMGGRPFHANSQSATLSPFSVPAYVLPFWDSLAVMAALKLFVAALGAFLLARAFGLRFAGAFMCGLVFGFSLWSVTWVSWTTMSVWALLPWLCLLAELCVRRPGPLPFAGLATVTGLQFLGGHPSSSFQVMVAVSVFWLVRVLASRPLRERDLPLRLFTLGAALVTGTALAAITLIPFAELLSHSIDLKARTAAASDAHEPARYLLGVFLHDWWGRGSRAPLEFASALEEHAWYVAALPLMLAVSALVLAPRRERIVVAARGPGRARRGHRHPALLRRGQGAARLRRRPQRAAGGGVGAVRGGAGGLGPGRPDRGPRGRRPGAAISRWPRCALLFAVPFLWVARRIDLSAFGDALGVAWGFADPDPGAVAEIRLASLLEWLVLGAAALGLLALRLRGRLAVPAFVGLALALVVVDLFKAGMGYNPAIAGEPRGAARHAGDPLPAGAAPRSLRRPASRGADHARGADPAQRGDALRALRRARLRLPVRGALRGAVAARDRQVARLQLRVLPRVGRPRAARAAGARPAGGDRPAAEPARPAAGAASRSPTTAPDARIYRNPAALPRAFLVDRQVVAPSADAARDTVTAAGFPARDVAVTEKRIAGLREGAAAAGSPGDARIVHYGEERVDVETDAERRSLLVLTDSWFPGWKAAVDGKDVPIERVDYLIRGVPVPAGQHRVEFSYAARQLARRLDPQPAGADRDPRGRPCVGMERRRACVSASHAARRSPPRCSTWCSRSSMFAPGLLRGARCRRPTTSGRPCPGRTHPPARRARARLEPGAGRRGHPVPAGPAGHARARCRTSRSGTRTSSAAARCSATRSRRCSRRSACPRTSCRSGTRWRSSRR